MLCHEFGEESVRGGTGVSRIPELRRIRPHLRDCYFSWGHGRGCQVDENRARGSEVTALQQRRQYSSLARNTHSQVANRENSKFDGWIDYDLLRNNLSHSVCQPLSSLPLPLNSIPVRWDLARVSTVCVAEFYRIFPSGICIDDTLGHHSLLGANESRKDPPYSWNQRISTVVRQRFLTTEELAEPPTTVRFAFAPFWRVELGFLNRGLITLLQGRDFLSYGLTHITGSRVSTEVVGQYLSFLEDGVRGFLN